MIRRGALAAPRSRRPRVLIAPNAFKGTLTAEQAADAMRRGVLKCFPRARTVLLPLSDGGDGLLDVMMTARGGKRVTVRVTGPTGVRRGAEFGFLRGPGRTAVVEMALASGLALIPARRRRPLTATSFGTGELIGAALARGATTVLVGLGGSATNDGGAGMAQALGYRLLDRRGREIGMGARSLLDLWRIERGHSRDLLGRAKVIGISDVENPLTGRFGSARVFGPQKGASPAMVAVLEKALIHFSRVIRDCLGVDVARVERGGAAGGVGAGLIAFLGASLRPGADYILKELDAASRLRKTDIALTGEGLMDDTSLKGKAPLAFSRAARKAGVPVVMVCGQSVLSSAQLTSYGVVSLATSIDAGASPRQAKRQPARWLAKAACRGLSAAAVLMMMLIGTAGAAEKKIPAEASKPSFAEIDRLYFYRHKNGNLEASREKLEVILSKTPEDPEALWRLGRSLVRIGERKESKKEAIAHYEKAKELTKKSVALDDKNAASHFWLGLSMGRHGEARGILKSLFMIKPLKREMRTVLELDPDHGGAHHVLGELYRQLPLFVGGSKRKAVKELELAVEVDPNHTAHYTSLADAYLARRKKKKAVAILKRIFDVTVPDDPGEFEDDLRNAREMLDELSPGWEKAGD